MPVRSYKPTSPGRRFQTVLDFSSLRGQRPEAALVEAKKSSGGRNNLGRMTARHRGGGHKRLYRLVDFRRDKDGIPARVVALEYDPNRSANIALVSYADGEKRYILAPVGVGVGDVLMSGEQADVRPGNALPLRAIPVGTMIHNVELKPGRGGQLGRAAGAAIQLMAKEGSRALLKMPSGELRYVHAECRATVGQVGNLDHENVAIGKAGRSRWLGRRPHVRGIAMNPVDHPHGGGEGRSKGNHPQSPWGQPAKGFKTRRNKHTEKFIVQRRTR